MEKLVPAKILFGLTIIYLLVGCSTTSKLSPNNTYTQIVKILSKSNPEPDEITFVKQNYSSIIEALEKNAESELQTDSRFRWKNALAIYSRATALNQMVANSSNFTEEFELKDYSNKIDQLSISAAEDIMLEGTEALQSGSRQGAKVAYFQFLEVDELSRGKIDTRALKSEAFEIAKVDVSIFIDTLNERGISLTSTGGSLMNILSQRSIAGPFVHFNQYDINDTDQSDHLVEIKLTDYVTGAISKSAFTQEVIDSNIPFEILEETLDLVFIFQVKVTDLGLGQVIENSTVRITRKLENLVGSFNGDTNKLNEYQSGLLKNKPLEGNPNYVFTRIKKPAIETIAGDVLDFYQNY